MKYNTRIENYMVNDAMKILNLNLDGLEEKIDDEDIKQLLIM